MKAILPEYENGLVIGEIDLPTPGPNEILIKVEAAGLNRADLVQKLGAYPPPAGASPILGLEVAGTVAETGTKVTRWSVGDRVCGLLAGGGYAEFVAMDEGSALPIPDNMSSTDASCFPEAMMTVWANVFMRAAFQSGEAFLCHGGTSGIGVMAIQMAKQAGASKIYATSGSAEKCTLAETLGADKAINYREEDFVETIRTDGGVDVVLGMVGGDYIQKNIDVAKLNGRIVNIAYQKGFQADVNFAKVLMKRLTLTATTLRARTNTEKSAIREAIQTKFWDAVTSGAIKPVLDSTFPLAEAEQAHQRMASGAHAGKIILTV